ncbi:MAG: penicillin-binding protein 2 [Propionibacteriaceae bacterium]|jgi:peptidoglycan glycosyltransferase|nr:penicillin-binding protein 2 [Propionibacteriaceae bacterium]
MNSSIRRVGIVAGLMFFALLINITASYLFRGPDLTNSPLNQRVLGEQFGWPRGPLMAGNTAIVSSEAVDSDLWANRRVYANGPMYAPITGYYSLNYGRSRLEQVYNAQLTSTSDSQVFTNVLDALAGRSTPGAIVQTTINASAQAAAWEAMQGRKGAVVAVDYTTGAILVYVSTPSYDPSLLASSDINQVVAAWDALVDDPSQPMSDRAGREIYPPGSTFKLVTTAAALEAGWRPDTMVDSPRQLQLPNSEHVLENFDGESCGGDRITMLDALKVSCNTAYANIGMALGASALQSQAEKFGFNDTFVSDIGSARSNFPTDIDAAQTAMSAIGQFEVAATPLQMTMVAAAVANHGVLMEPYFVSEIRNPDLSVLSIHAKNPIRQALSEQSAGILAAMMIENATSGGATPAQVDGLTVGGKTGTAQSATGVAPYYWFVGFVEESHVAIGVFVEETKPGDPSWSGGVAGPAFRAVAEALR